MDVVEETNLNRQILHYDRDIGRKKTASAEEKLRELNPDIIIKTIDVKIDASNAKKLVGNADGIVDAMDNYQTRYQLNEVAIVKKIPFFHGGIRGFYGQATTIIPGTTPCLKCIFPNPPPREEFPVIGATAGIIGTIQSNEVIKYLTDTGDLLTNRLFIWDGMQSHAEEIRIERDLSCQACGGMGKEKKAGDKK
jgi:adenylyltransferase/sulfurtransferase